MRKSSASKLLDIIEVALEENYARTTSSDEVAKRILLTSPSPACPGPELEALRREIGEMARQEATQWKYSTELDPIWPPSAKIYKRLYRTE